jgi:hypothetical protein
LSTFDRFPEPRFQETLETLVESLNSTVNSTVMNADSVSSDSLRKLLSLVSNIAREVQNAFSETLPIFIRLKYLTPHDEMREVLSAVDELRYGSEGRRDRYFCRKLRQLCESYQDLVLPELVQTNLKDLESWLDVFFMFDFGPFSHLGIEELAFSEIYPLVRELEQGQPSEEDYKLVRERAAYFIEKLNDSLAELQVLNNKILGLSGRVGFLELVNDPEQLQQASIAIMKDVNMVNEGDTYHIGQAGAAGRFARSDNNTFVQSGDKKTLTEAAIEIQQLLKHLEDTNPTATEIEKITYINDETTPSFKRRVVGALQASGETAIDELILENKYLKVAKAAIKGWLQPGD